MTKTQNFRLITALMALFLTFTACEKNENPLDPTPTDPCENVTCYNDGYCDDGTCVCQPGWTGANCNTQVTPKQINITKIEINSFSGSGYDLLDGPDVYVVVLNEGGSIIHKQPSFFEDAVSGHKYTYMPATPIALHNPTSKHIIRLYDYDDGLSSDDFIGGIIGFVYNTNNKFPQSLTLQASGMSVTLYLAYYW